MNGKTVDVMIHIQTNDGPEPLAEMVDDVAQIAGVTKAQLSPHAKHMLAVEYDPDRVSGHAILDVIKTHGYGASLVGM